MPGLLLVSFPYHVSCLTCQGPRIRSRHFYGAGKVQDDLHKASESFAPRRASGKTAQASQMQTEASHDGPVWPPPPTPSCHMAPKSGTKMAPW